MTDKPLIPAVREVLAPFAKLADELVDWLKNPTVVSVGTHPPGLNDILNARDLLARLDALDAEELAQEIGREAVARNFFGDPWHADDVRAGNQDGTTRVQAAVAGARRALQTLGVGE